jgi:cystathionine beta-lyase/cystathionine gamma-synthase
MRLETRAIHDGQPPDAQTGAVAVPVYQASTFAQDAIGQTRGFEYSRIANPTRTALEQTIASLESGRFGLAFASGSAASTAVLQLLRPGDHLIASADLYGGTYRLFERIYRPWGIETSYVDTTQLSQVAAAIRPNSRMLWIESPTNPLLKLADIALISALCRKHRLWLVVDNTFASPYFQRPLELGADLVVHSTTKYLGGHSDVLGGAVVTSHQELFSKIKSYQNAAGAVPGPWDCWLVMRGIKTLGVRMRAHASNALHLARFLQSHPAVERVYYPGLPEHPQYELAQRQMFGFGGMISVELKGGFPAVERFVSCLKVFILAESLGGVESLVGYPPRMSHAAMPIAERHRRGLQDNLVRLSVGIEHIDDLTEDLEQALRQPNLVET